MSEFTDGLLFLHENHKMAEQAAHELGQPYFIKQLNDKWSALFVEKMDINDWLVEHSNEFPMLYFQHPSDHGWGYRVFRDGKLVARLFVKYELSFFLWLELAEARYPHVRDVIGELDGATSNMLYDEVNNSETYRQEVAAQYASPNVEQFLAFGISESDVSYLRKVLTPEWYHERMFEQVQEFMRVLGITDMSWMSYRYLSRREEQ